MDGCRLRTARVMALVAMGFVGGGCAKDMASTTPRGAGGSPGTGSGGAGAGSGGSGAGTGGGAPASDGAVTDAPTDGLTDGRPAEPLGIFTAADDLQGFALNTFSNADNLGDPTRDGGAMATLGWDGTEGTPDKGALKVVASYSAFTQFVIVQHDFSDLDVRDWTGRKLHLWLKIATGNTGGRPVKVFVQDQIAGTEHPQHCNQRSIAHGEEVVRQVSLFEVEADESGTQAAQRAGPRYGNTAYNGWSVEPRRGARGSGSASTTASAYLPGSATSKRGAT